MMRIGTILRELFGLNQNLESTQNRVNSNSLQINRSRSSFSAQVINIQAEFNSIEFNSNQTSCSSHCELPDLAENPITELPEACEIPENVPEPETSIEEEEEIIMNPIRDQRPVIRPIVNLRPIPRTIVAANESGYVAGDPHFRGADGGGFDVMGDAGKVYNIFNDQGLQINAKFDKPSPELKGNYITQTGLLLGPNGAHRLEYQTVPKTLITLDGKKLHIGTRKKLSDGTEISFIDRMLRVKTPEGYIIDHTLFKNRRYSFLNVFVKSSEKGVAQDGRLPGGMLGETFDVDNQQRRATNKQGAGALNYHYSDYEVPGGIFDTGDKKLYADQLGYQEALSAKKFSRLPKIIRK